MHSAEEGCFSLDPQLHLRVFWKDLWEKSELKFPVLHLVVDWDKLSKLLDLCISVSPSLKLRQEGIGGLQSCPTGSLKGSYGG